MYTISLNNLEFYAFHGFYQEENLIGNIFLVDMFVKIPDQIIEVENLDSTVNYEMLFAIAKMEMQNPQKLLETVVKNMHDKVKKLNPNIQHIHVIIRKKHVPIEGMIGYATVEYQSNN